MSGRGVEAKAFAKQPAAHVNFDKRAENLLGSILCLGRSRKFCFSNGFFFGARLIGPPSHIWPVADKGGLGLGE